MTVIYVDILVAINLVLDYLLLFGTSRISGSGFSRLKGLCGAILGAFYSLAIIFDLPKIIFLLSKFVVSSAMIRITFGKRKVSEFIRLMLIFYICGFVFCGVMMLINSFSGAELFFVKGGIIYFELSALEIVISGTASFIVTEIFRRLFHHGEAEGAFVAKIFYQGKNAVLNGFTDTGNFLSDPISASPVAVVNEESLKKILPKEMIEAVKNRMLSTDFDMRLIPAKSVSGSALMPAFRPDRFAIANEKGEFETEDILIAFSENVPENTVIIGKNVIFKENGKFVRRCCKDVC